MAYVIARRHAARMSWRYLCIGTCIGTLVTLCSLVLGSSLTPANSVEIKMPQPGKHRQLAVGEPRVSSPRSTGGAPFIRRTSRLGV